MKIGSLIPEFHGYILSVSTNPCLSRSNSFLAVHSSPMAATKNMTREPAMPAEQNEATFRRWVKEGVNKKDISLVRETFAEEFRNATLPPESPQGLDAHERAMEEFFAAFPDMLVRLDRVVADDDQIGYYATLTGTHQAEFLGIPATGRNVTFVSSGVDRWRMERLWSGGRPSISSASLCNLGCWRWEGNRA